MNWKKFFVVAVASLAFMINIPQVSAEEVEVFGEEFEDNKPAKVQPAENSVEEVQKNEVQSVESSKTEIENFNSEDEFDDEEFGDELNFDNLTPPPETPPPVDNIPTLTVTPENPVNPNTDLDINYAPSQENTNQPSRSISKPAVTQKQKKLKQLKPRFVKLTMDESYIYYLDKQAVSWRRVPYFASEYMADVWIRMIERNDENLEYPSDAVAMAAEQGNQLADSDIEVLQHRRYYLEHYYLRPKTEQIQFLSELEVVDRPQNTANERNYDFKNWEYLIPGSTESVIYRTVIQIIGKDKATDKGHMHFADMLDEYARIAIR